MPEALLEELPIELAKNRAHTLLADLERALASGEIDEATWYQRVAAVITPAYLAADNPRAQSGHSGDETHWTQARRLITDAIDRDGDFLDVGCASGYLMECVVRWLAERSVRIEPHGLDIAPELAALARARVPRWAERIHVGNALEWRPPRRYEFVRTGLEYVPRRRRADLLSHLLERVVAPGGRLLIGTYNEEIDATRREPSVAEEIASWGFAIAGTTERPHYRDSRLMYRVSWLDASG